MNTDRIPLVELVYATPERARAEERISEWERARQMWAYLGRQDDVNACQMIIDANALGDRYRAEVLRRAGEEPDKCENAHAWVKWYAIMSEVYKEIYT
jgi:hypothetical protein